MKTPDPFWGALPKREERECGRKEYWLRSLGYTTLQIADNAYHSNRTFPEEVDRLYAHETSIREKQLDLFNSNPGEKMRHNPKTEYVDITPNFDNMFRQFECGLRSTAERLLRCKKNSEAIAVGRDLLVFLNILYNSCNDQTKRDAFGVLLNEVAGEVAEHHDRLVAEESGDEDTE